VVEVTEFLREFCTGEMAYSIPRVFVLLGFCARFDEEAAQVGECHFSLVGLVVFLEGN
jgi:hypothetical protein